MLLTGCAGGQSKLEACTILKDGLTEVNTALTDSVGDLQADPEAAATGMKSAVSDSASAVADAVTPLQKTCTV